MHCLLVVLFVSLLPVTAADWPEFLGPRRDGSTREAISGSWEQTAPKVLWSKPVGGGFSGPIVADGTTFLFHRRDGAEILQALDAATGESKWENKAPATYRDDFGFDNGPRSTPCVAGDRLFAMGADGLIRCVAVKSGKTIWSVDARKKFEAGKGFFGMACSPVVHKSLVLLSIGGKDGAGIIALDQSDGRLRWKALEDEAGYASPVIGKVGDSLAAVFFTREGLAVLEPEAGRVIAKRPWRARMQASVNAASPLLIDGLVFATSSYETGAILARVRVGRIEEIWSGDDQLSSHYATPVHSDGFLYGFHGRQEMGPSFRCIELKTGKVRWDEPGFGAGSATLVGTNLLLLKETGELLLASTNPDRFLVTGRAQFLGDDTRAFPAVSNKRLFARDKRRLVCVQLP